MHLEVNKQEVSVLRAALNRAVENLTDTRIDLLDIFGVTMSSGDLFMHINELRSKIRNLKED